MSASRSYRDLLVALAVTTLALTTGLAPSAVAGARGPAGSPPPVELRVATYNIRAGSGGDNVFDLDRTAAAIAETGADVVALQEVDVAWGARSLNLDVAQELAGRLDMHVGFAPIYSLEPAAAGEPRREYGVAVLSRYPVLEFINHDLTRLSTQGADPVPEPAPGFAEMVVQAKGSRVHVYSTHLDYRADPTVREMQVADTLEILAADGEGADQVLLGDFNAPPASPELAPLWEQLTDAFRQVGQGPGATYPARTPTARIDYVAVSPGIDVVDAHVPDTTLARQASDHRPVVADLLLPRGEQE